jgi:hypothetical protein
MKQFTSGELVGNGAAQNVELGWIPDLVIVNNVTGGDRMSIGYPNRMAIPFSDGGDDAEIVVGEKITGATTGATAVIKTILLYSGTWAAGDAAGFFIIERDTLTGTFGSEQVLGASGGGDATVTVNVNHTVEVDLDNLALVTGTSAISAYVGVDATNSKGFTIGAVIAEEAHLLRWTAFRN